jgi:hypothetical protein
MSTALIVANPLGSMDASGTGVVESLMHANSGHDGITHEFIMDVLTTDDLFTAFSWEDTNTEGDVDASSGIARYTITLDNAKFHTGLKALIEGAVGGKCSASYNIFTSRTSAGADATIVDPRNIGNATKIAQTVLDREIRVEVEDKLDANDVLEYLEGDSLGEFQLVLDASGGAADMTTKMNASEAILHNLLQQFPNRTDVVGLTDSSGQRLPVKAGDKVAFVFDVNPQVSITQVASNGQYNVPVNNNNTQNDLGAEITSFTSSNRRIAFIAKVI